MPGVATSIDRWDFRTRHVAEEIDQSKFISARSTIIAAGPPKLRYAGDASRIVNARSVNAFAYPMAVVDTLTVSQGLQLQTLFEIGSEDRYFVSGHTVNQCSIARTLYSGPSLLRVLYAWYPNTKINPTVAQMLSTGAGALGSLNAPRIRVQPGYSDFFINLVSELFKQPFGLYIMHLDSNGAPYGAIYLENAHVTNHQYSISAGSVLTAEGASITFNRVVPVDVGAISAVEQNQSSLESILSGVTNALPGL